MRGYDLPRARIKPMQEILRSDEMIAESQHPSYDKALTGATATRLIGLKSLLKQILYASGVFGAWHRRRNRNCLTVVQFHRVLPPWDKRFPGCNPAYTVTPNELDKCLGLFKHFYSVVSLTQVRAARQGKEVLPDRPLLITFDDGWQDNFQYALPILQRHGLPAVIFLATAYVGSENGFWQEEVMDAVLRGRLDSPDCNVNPTVLLARLAAMPRAERQYYIDGLPRTFDLPRRMLDRAELRALQAGGVDIGGHGHLHEPITEVDDPQYEFTACRERLCALGLFEETAAFSFPHGRFAARLVSIAREAGFDLLFTSTKALTPCADLLTCKTIGRIEMDLRPFRLATGKMDSAPLLFHLASQSVASSLARAST